MKIFKTFTLFSFLMLLLAACDQNQNTAEQELAMQETVNPDEVTNRWTEAWRTNQYDSLRNMTADDALVMLNGREMPRDSIQGWLQQSATNMRDLETNSLNKGTQGNVVWESGTFSHGYANDTATTYQGTYTFIWERTDGEQNDWKAKVMHISADMGMDTLVMQQDQQIQ